MTELELKQLFQRTLETYFPQKKYDILVTFSRAKTLRHSIQLKSRALYMRITRLPGQAPQEVYQALALILFFKLFRYKVDKEIRKIYKNYIDQFETQSIVVKTPKVSSKYTAEGRYFNLEEIFDKINLTHFNNTLTKPVLGWSLNRAYTRLGFYDNTRNLLVISSIFDSKKTDPQVLEFLMYHEMLHIHIPVKSVNGKRRIHTAEFKKLEKQFPNFEKIQKWIKRKRFRL